MHFEKCNKKWWDSFLLIPLGLNSLPGSCAQCTEVRFASFLSGGFITAIEVNPLERKLAKRTSVQCSGAISICLAWQNKESFSTKCLQHSKSGDLCF